MKVLAVSGSLRAASLNSAFCRAAARLAPPGVTVSIYPGLAELPLFNPDLEAAPPPAVACWREAFAAADAVLVASPEYAHGVTGVIKNALDWLVSFEGAVGKPVGLINTSPRARHAHESLAEILRTMSLDIVEGASLAIPLHGYCRTDDDMTSSAGVRESIGRIFAALGSESR